jgi:hypothetical protein
MLLQCALWCARATSTVRREPRLGAREIAKGAGFQPFASHAPRLSERYSQFPSIIRADRKKPAIGAHHDSGDWKANGTREIALHKRKVNRESLLGLATRRESSNVCVYGEA